MDFLERYGWSNPVPLAQDGSSRAYYRVEKGAHTAIVMDCSGRQTPGHGVKDFIRIGGWLRDVGLSAPEIYEIDERAGLVLIEDFGDVSFKVALAAGGDLYPLAAEILNHLAGQDCPLDLPDYFESHVHRNHRFVLEWYAPDKNDFLPEYESVWADIEDCVPPCPQGFVHIDYHAENLMFLPGRAGLKRCGILDFQGAMKGPVPYDLGNLLEDARMDISKDIRRKVLSQQSEDFQAWYRILTTQFHCRVLGQFVKMAEEDGRRQYLSCIPRVEGYMKKALDDPLLNPLKAFFLKIGVDFAGATYLNSDRV